MMKYSRIEVYSEGADWLGEGPLWSSADQALYWVDIGRKMLFRKAPSDVDRRSWPLPDHPGCLAEMARGLMGVAMGDGVYQVELSSRRTELLAAAPARRSGTRFNDGKTDALGRLWVGTMLNNFGPNDQQIPIDRSDGSLYRIEPDASVHVVEENIGIPNTVAWSPDLKRFYFADSLRGEMFVYDFDMASGAAVNKRLFFKSDEHGLPDGSAMDVDGCLWNARWGGSAVLRLTPDGRIDQVIELPVSQPTSCAFGGPNHDTLFVTSATLGLSAEDQAAFPLSGSIFALKGLAQGIAVPPLATKRVCNALVSNTALMR